MKLKFCVAAIVSIFGTGLASQSAQAGWDFVRSVEFVGMDAPASPEEKADIYTTAKVKYTFRFGRSKTYDLKYHRLMATTDVIKGRVVGGLFDANDSALTDADGQMASDAPDGTSLIDIPGMRSTHPFRFNALALVTQFEYKELPPNDGLSSGSFWSKLPATMGLARVDQNRWTGALEVVDYEHVSFSDVYGGWIHCGSTMSSWNTHIGAEEYEPDAKTREGLEKASGSDDGTDIASFSKYYFGDAAAASPYHYGLVPEVTVNRRGEASAVKHYATGRFAREMQEMASDERTAIGGDDGKNTGLFMFVADIRRDLSAGTIYAAKLTQTSAENGGTFDLQWIKLGHASDDEIKALVDGGIKFTDMFDVSNVDPGDASFSKVTTYMGTEWLKLKPGMEKAAAFLETRRYAALLGATTEFSKMEYIAFNRKDRKFYVVISRVEAGMADTSGDIQVARNDGGIILEMGTAPGIEDTNGDAIDSRFVGTSLASIPELVGGWNGGVKDAEGNQCSQDKLCGPDNLRYVDSIRTLFIGEDTSRRNNNYVWAFNIDTRKLSRILSVPMNAEATGLTVVPGYGGHAYIMSNFQHPGEGGTLSNYLGADRQQVLDHINSKWGGRKKAAIGYIGTENGALPAFD